MQLFMWKKEASHEYKNTVLKEKNPATVINMLKSFCFSCLCWSYAYFLTKLMQSRDIKHFDQSTLIFHLKNKMFYFDHNFIVSIACENETVIKMTKMTTQVVSTTVLFSCYDVLEPV